MADSLATLMYRMSRNSGILKLLEPQVPAQACKGVALPVLDY